MAKNLRAKDFVALSSDLNDFFNSNLGKLFIGVIEDRMSMSMRMGAEFDRLYDKREAKMRKMDMSVEDEKTARLMLLRGSSS